MPMVCLLAVPSHSSGKHPQAASRFVQFETCISNWDRRIIRAAASARQQQPHSQAPGLTRMARAKHRVSEPPKPPARGVKAATYNLLLDTAMQLIQQGGHIPAVAEVAV